MKKILQPNQTPLPNKSHKNLEYKNIHQYNDGSLQQTQKHSSKITNKTMWSELYIFIHYNM